MLDLGQYIVQLLLSHDCVIVPGFGGFVANYQDAVHNESSHTFYPPSKKIVFNSSLSHNDGLLISSVAEQLGVGYDEAAQLVAQSVDEAWIMLEKGNTLKLEGIGFFRYSDDSALTFEPQLTENLLTESYGLCSFRFPPLSYQSQPETVINNDNIRKMPVIDTKKVLRYAAVVVPIAVLVGIIPFYRQYQQTETVPVSMPVNQPIEDTISATIPAQSVDYAIEASTDKRAALFYNETSSQTTKVQKNKRIQSGIFYIIGGSFKDRANAEKYVKKYKKAGFDSEIIETDNLYRVSLGVYGDKVIALHELRRIRAKEDYSNAWLYTKAD
ncbi:MAG: SPOR domain-containing protein [Salinivirgaceae bacterium]|jgi:nucleoid DNA-binding protein|nr:SPOR domain-containing protein [Salinivirgaceae bacterium]MBR4619685.1 SPOR domain-containing protein [Salinivirgaceae bacterium]